MGTSVTFKDETVAPSRLRELAQAGAAERNIPMGYLRAFVTVLVVAHHSLIAYHPDAPAPAGA